MKIFVLKRKSVIFYAIMFVAAAATLMTKWDSSSYVFNNNTDLAGLPVYCVDKGEEKICSISFDAAWGADDTPQLIKILDEYNVKATFFVVGAWVDKYPDAVKMLSDAGHEVMNHSDTHPHMTQLSHDAMKKEVESCGAKIEKITGKKPNLFRPPYGDYNSDVVNALADCKYYTIQWSVDSLDWKNLTANEIYSRVTENIHPGAIVLFHNAAKNTPEALPQILQYLKENGYKTVPISKLIYKDDYKIDNTGKQIKK